jgi:hypothetical protein
MLFMTRNTTLKSRDARVATIAAYAGHASFGVPYFRK